MVKSKINWSAAAAARAWWLSPARIPSVRSCASRQPAARRGVGWSVRRYSRRDFGDFAGPSKKLLTRSAVRGECWSTHIPCVPHNTRLHRYAFIPACANAKQYRPSSPLLDKRKRTTTCPTPSIHHDDDDFFHAPALAGAAAVVIDAPGIAARSARTALHTPRRGRVQGSARPREPTGDRQP